MADVAEPTVRDLERGTREPKDETVDKVLKAIEEGEADAKQP